MEGDRTGSIDYLTFPVVSNGRPDEVARNTNVEV
jgi:hypothetical protein